MTCDDKTSVVEANHVNHRKFLLATVKFTLKVRKVNVITCTQKYRNSIAASTAPFTIVPHTINQEPIRLARRKGNFSEAP